MTCQIWLYSTLAVPGLGLFFSVEKCRIEQVFPAELPHAVPELFFLLAALNLQTAHFQQCSLNKLDANNAAIKELASVLFSLLFSSLPLWASHPLRSAFQALWRTAGCVCWDNFSWKPCQDSLSRVLVVHFRINALLNLFPNLTCEVEEWDRLGGATRCTLHHLGSLSSCCAAKISCVPGTQTQRMCTPAHASRQSATHASFSYKPYCTHNLPNFLSAELPWMKESFFIQPLLIVTDTWRKHAQNLTHTDCYCRLQQECIVFYLICC